MYGMTIREQIGRVGTRPVVDRIAAGEPLALPAEIPDVRGYVELALRGGYPEPALRLSEEGRRRWVNSYVEQLPTRDAPDADAYEHLLANLMVVESVPAWSTSRLKRLVLTPKRYVLDTGVLAGLLRLDATAILRDGDLLGRLLDTFVAAQIRPELTISDSLPRLYHVRQEQGRHEIDLLAEMGARRVVAFEVRATAAPGLDDARHLEWLRDRLEAGFVAGVVFHTGPAMFHLADRITAVPICALWG
jgi:predicted AAA+ superfamily ATPase